MPLPPWSQVWPLVWQLLLPTAAVTLLVTYALRRLGGELLMPLAAGLGVALGLLVGNWCRDVMPWRLDSEVSLTLTDVADALGRSLEPRPAPEDEEATPVLPVPPARYWLPWLMGVVGVIELGIHASRATGGFAWAVRTAVSFFSGRLLTPEDLRGEAAWLPWALGLVVLIEWAVLACLAHKWQDGTLPTASALMMACAGVVLLHAHSARLTDMALLMFAALLGLALCAWKLPGNASPGLAMVAIFLPGLLLSGQHETFSEVPRASFLLMASAPLALLPLLVPILNRQERWFRWLAGILLPLLPLLWALYLAMQAETLEFE